MGDNSVKKVINHKSQHIPDTKRKRKETQTTTQKTNKRKARLYINRLVELRWINHKATRSKSNTGSTALERSMGGGGGWGALKHFYSRLTSLWVPMLFLILKCIKKSVRIMAPNTFLLTSEKRSTLKGKNLLPVGANSFRLEQTPFQKGIGIQGRKEEVRKITIVKNWLELSHVYPFTKNWWIHDLVLNRNFSEKKKKKKKKNTYLGHLVLVGWS